MAGGFDSSCHAAVLLCSHLHKSCSGAFSIFRGPHNTAGTGEGKKLPLSAVRSASDGGTIPRRFSQASCSTCLHNNSLHAPPPPHFESAIITRLSPCARRILLALPLVLLASCGGGGNESPSVSAPPVDPEPQPPTNQPETAPPQPCINAHDLIDSDFKSCLSQSEFQAEQKRRTQLIKKVHQKDEIEFLGQANQWREMINTYEAYANISLTGGDDIRPGKGVKLGFVDSGLHLRHPEFVAQGEGSAVFKHVDSTFEGFFERSHGTAVVGAAGGFNTGIASGADIIMFGSRNPNPLKSDFVDLSEDSWFQIFNSDVDILNLSFGPDTTNEWNYSIIRGLHT